MNTLTVADAKKACARALEETSPTPLLDAECLLQHILGCDRTQLLLRRGDLLTDRQAEAVAAATEKRKTGLPIAYITGHKEFFGYDFYVTPAVLIPKPDTELLVELTLSAIEDKRLARASRVLTLCDMCTGSGCVGISIQAENAKKDDAQNLATTFVDISAAALDIARANAERLLFQANVPNSAVHFVQSNLFENIPHTFDLIVTNPPYVPGNEARELLKDGRNEPLLALDGDVNDDGSRAESSDGLNLIRRLIPQCYGHLCHNGVLLMETGEYNAEEAARLFEATGFRGVHIERDLSGLLRVVCGVKSPTLDAERRGMVFS